MPATRYTGEPGVADVCLSYRRELLIARPTTWACGRFEAVLELDGGECLLVLTWDSPPELAFFQVVADVNPKVVAASVCV